MISFAFVGCGRLEGPPEGASKADAETPAARRQAPSSREPYAPLDRVSVTHTDQKMPPNCGPRQVVGLMTDFVDAFNKGDEPRLERLFPERASLLPRLFAMNRGSKIEFTTDKRDALIDYFTERHTKSDRLELVSVEVRQSNATSAEKAYADVTYSMNRRADDLQIAPGAWRKTVGKSVIDCRRQVLTVTSLSTS